VGALGSAGRARGPGAYVPRRVHASGDEYAPGPGFASPTGANFGPVHMNALRSRADDVDVGGMARTTASYSPGPGVGSTSLGLPAVSVRLFVEKNGAYA